MKKIIGTEAAPAAIGPYSQAVVAGGFLFVSGQIPIDPQTNRLVEGDIAVQTKRVLDNIAAILGAAGSTLAKVVKTNVYMSDLSEFGQMNEIYASYFPTDPPARATVQVARLPRDVRVEIDAIALEA